MNLKFNSIKDILLQIPIFGAMSEDEVKTLLSMITIEKFSKGSTIIEEGGSPKNLYIIKSGEISVVKDGIELIKLSLGDSFGEVELLGILPNLASCIALSDCELLILPKKILYDLKKSNSEFFVKLILNISRECCRRLAKADNFIIHNIDVPTEDGDYY